jgi:hypothetical protein
MGKIATRLLLDSEGVAEAVEGLESFDDELKKNLPPDLYEAIAPAMNAKALETKYLLEWDGEVGQFTGQTREIGDPFSVEGDYPLPNGQAIRIRTTFTITKSECAKFDGCVRIGFTNATQNSEALSGLLGGLLERLARASDPSGKTNLLGQIQEYSLNGSGELIVDPTTMRIFSQNFERRMKMTVDTPRGRAVPVMMTQSREQQYEYPN